jgi:hypothetical protein
VFKEYEETDCLISELSGWDDEYEREICDDFCDGYKPCFVRLPYYEVEDIIKWFFETQKDKIEYIED